MNFINLHSQIEHILVTVGGNKIILMIFKLKKKSRILIIAVLLGKNVVNRGKETDVLTQATLCLQTVCLANAFVLIHPEWSKTNKGVFCLKNEIFESNII